MSRTPSGVFTFHQNSGLRRLAHSSATPSGKSSSRCSRHRDGAWRGDLSRNRQIRASRTRRSRLGHPWTGSRVRPKGRCYYDSAFLRQTVLFEFGDDRRRRGAGPESIIHDRERTASTGPSMALTSIGTYSGSTFLLYVRAFSVSSRSLPSIFDHSCLKFCK